MFKLVLPALICSAVIVGSASSMTARSAIPDRFEAPVTSTQGSFDETFAKLESCETNEISIYFHDEYITFHSAEIINEAMLRVADCDIDQVNVTLLDTASGDRPVSAAKSELMAYSKAHNLDTFVRYDIAKTADTTETLNGLTATVKFVVDSAQ